MWNLEETERLVLYMLPITVVAAALLLLWMSASLKPERLSLTFAGSVPTALTLQRP